MRKLTRNRSLIACASVLALLVVLGISQAVLERTAEAQSKGAVQAPRFEVDPLWPKPLPNHWVLGSTIGVWVDTDDHVWIIHRSSATLANNEKALETKTAANAARARRRCSSSIRQATCCATGADRAQGYEWPDSNHGIFIDYKGNVWIGGNGGPDSHILKFTKDGKFLLQVGKKGARRKAGAARGQPGRAGRRLCRRQQRPGELRPRREDLRRSEGERGLHRRRLSEQARRGARCRHRQDEAVLGRVRQQAGRHAAAAVRSRGAARAAVPQPGALRRHVGRSAASTSATASTIASRSSRPTASSSRKRSSRRTRRAPARCGTSRSRRTRSRSTSSWPTA